MTIQVFNDGVEINGSQDIEQLKVKANSTQTEALQEWQDNSGNVLSEIDANGHLLVGDPDGSADALIEAHNINDANKPARGLHSKGTLSGTLSNLVSWVVQELNLTGDGGISALHRALRVQATNDNTGSVGIGADVRAGDFEVINANENATNTENLEMSAIVAKVNNQTNATLDKAYGLKVEMVDEGTANEIYAIHTDVGIVHFGDILELADDSTHAPLNITPRATAPSPAQENDIYLHQVGAGDYVWRRHTGSGWEDIGGGDVSGSGSSTNNAITRWDGTGGDTIQDSGITIDDNNVLKLISLGVQLNMPEQSSEPSSPSTDDIYMDDGTHTASGLAGMRKYDGADWQDIGGGGGGNYETLSITDLSDTSTDGVSANVPVTITGSDITVTIDGGRNLRISITSHRIILGGDSAVGWVNVVLTQPSSTITRRVAYMPRRNDDNTISDIVFAADELEGGATDIELQIVCSNQGTRVMAFSNTDSTNPISKMIVEEFD